MFRHAFLFLGLTAVVLAGCRSPSAAGPAAPQWGAEVDSLGSPGTFMDAPIESPVAEVGAGAEIRQPSPEPGGLAAPQVRRRDGSVVESPASRARTAPAARTGSTAFTFRLQVGDEISMQVWKEKELTTKQRIIPGGSFSPPLLGSIRAAGLTLDQLRDDLTNRYRTYLKDPKVSLNVEGIYSDRVFVLGEVEDAQAVDLHGPTSVVQSIAMAGGFKEEYAEKRTIHLIRRGPGGRPRVYNVNVCQVLAGRITDPPLQRGDIVFVPARGVTNWARTVGQALAPISTGLVSAGAIAGTVTLFSGNNN